MVNFFKGTKDRASFFLSPKLSHHTESRMNHIYFTSDTRTSCEFFCTLYGGSFTYSEKRGEKLSESPSSFTQYMTASPLIECKE